MLLVVPFLLTVIVCHIAMPVLNDHTVWTKELTMSLTFR